MSQPESTRDDLCKELGLACHDALESGVISALRHGRLSNGQIVRLSVEVESESGERLATFSSVGPIAQGTDEETGEAA
jgi:hypothetical protein